MRECQVETPFNYAALPIKRGNRVAKMKQDLMNTQSASFPDLLETYQSDDRAAKLITLLSSGGDARITLDPESGLNKYYSAPYPRKTLAYASSTANDMSEDAFRHLLALGDVEQRDYAGWLDDLRSRIRAAYDLPDDVEVVFAPSGTDLEYVALAAVLGKAEQGIHNILLGADEVGSGCIHSAHGRYFAGETALGHDTQAGTDVEGMESITLADVPVRCELGQACTSTHIYAAIAEQIDLAIMAGRHALVHVVHGSKTGLILPELGELDQLQARFAGKVNFVIDACQARITSDAVRDYLARDAIVFLTGSKFMGGPPFNGFALVPRALVEQATQLPAGLARIFRAAEFPAGWPGQGNLPASANIPLALRYEASIFELERFQALGMVQITRIIEAFCRAIQNELLQPLGLTLVMPFPPGEAAEARQNPIEMRTLATIDISDLPQSRTFEDSQALHKKLALDGLRLGQPVKSVRIDGTWGGTLRIGLSMPQFSQWAELNEADLQDQLGRDMRVIAARLTA